MGGAGRMQEKTKIRGKSWEVLVAMSMFDPEVFKMRDRILLFTIQAKNWCRGRDIWCTIMPSGVYGG